MRISHLFTLALAGVAAATAVVNIPSSTVENGLIEARSAVEDVGLTQTLDLSKRTSEEVVKRDGAFIDIDDSDEAGIATPFHSFTMSFIMILFAEIGDKTFLIAALMAMKHSRTLVFSAAISSLIVMTILSAILGHAVPTLLPKQWTNFAASILFFIFGGKMIKEGLEMDANAGVEEELQEVAEEIEEKELGKEEKDMEAGNAKPRNVTDDKGNALVAGIQNLAGLVFSPAWVQTFVMTFLGEWGDRSQIATIAMAAGQGYTWVIIGAISGHSICTGIAVVGGKMLATKISVRHVTLGGAGAFLVFGIIYMYEALYGANL